MKSRRLLWKSCTAGGIKPRAGNCMFFYWANDKKTETNLFSLLRTRTNIFTCCWTTSIKLYQDPRLWRDPDEGDAKAVIVLTSMFNFFPFTGRLMGKEIDNYFSGCKLTDWLIFCRCPVYNHSSWAPFLFSFLLWCLSERSPAKSAILLVLAHLFILFVRNKMELKLRNELKLSVTHTQKKQNKNKWAVC